MAQVGGVVAAGWEAVRDAFVNNLDNSEEVGAGVSVYHRGNKVVDLWGGSFDVEKTQPYAEDTLQLVFSTFSIGIGTFIQCHKFTAARNIAGYFVFNNPTTFVFGLCFVPNASYHKSLLAGVKPLLAK